MAAVVYTEARALPSVFFSFQENRSGVTREKESYMIPSLLLPGKYRFTSLQDGGVQKTKDLSVHVLLEWQKHLPE